LAYTADDAVSGPGYSGPSRTILRDLRLTGVCCAASIPLGQNRQPPRRNVVRPWRAEAAPPQVIETHRHHRAAFLLSPAGEHFERFDIVSRQVVRCPLLVETALSVPTRSAWSISYIQSPKPGWIVADASPDRMKPLPVSGGLGGRMSDRPSQKSLYGTSSMPELSPAEFGFCVGWLFGPFCRRI
jgi:hypothetical protein